MISETRTDTQPFTTAPVYSSTVHVLVIGFYHRRNLGDDAYVGALGGILGPNVRTTFVCVDDLDVIPDGVDVVVCGGGEVINAYFMQKFQRLLVGYTGRAYAVSVGIAYESERGYLKMFDHVFVRSRRDFEVAAAAIGERNVTLTPDAALSLSLSVPERPPLSKRQNKTVNVAVCLAQPYFYENPAADAIETRLVDALVSFAADHPRRVVYHFVPFNRSPSSVENDQVIHDRVRRRLTAALGKGRAGDRADLVAADNVDPVRSVLDYFARDIDLVVGMRFHSVVFARRAGCRVVSMALRGQKIDKLLTDHGLRDDAFVELACDAAYKPTGLDASLLGVRLRAAVSTPRPQPVVVGPEIPAVIRDAVVEGSKTRSLRVDYERRDAFEDLATRISDVYLSMFEFDGVRTARDLLFRTGPIVRPRDLELSMRLARFACYVLTNNTDHACVWGLRARLSHPRLKLWDTFAIVWNVHNRSVRTAQVDGGEYYVDLVPAAVPRKVWWTLDRTTFAQEYSGLHRSGWAYAIAGLMHHDATMMGRDASDAPLIDTYLDRTFHWSREVFERLGIIPYRKPWYGFVHHTFDTSFSDYNCVRLLECPSFQASLPSCKGIVTLSQHLGERMRRGLAESCPNPPPVFVVDHPTELLEDASCFSMAKFGQNATRRVVQIGAWLRDSYAVYALPLPQDGGPLKLRKACLRWKNMTQNFEPRGLADKLDAWLDDEAQHYADDAEDVDDASMCRNDVCGMLCRNHACPVLCCRNDASAENAQHYSRNHVVNKHVEGMRIWLRENNGSVEVLEGLENDAYDRLLTENIVFLKLFEPSAVNTVLECVVRNTPIVVNREPAVEEMLGADYPGFYGSLFEAGAILCDAARIEAMHRHIAGLDKSRFRLERFVARMQDIVSGAAVPLGDDDDDHRPEDPEETVVPPSPAVVLHRPLARVQRFIPHIFRR